MLVNAIINNNEKIALNLIEKGIDINLFDEQGRPILIYSCNYGLDRASAALIKLNFNNIIKLKYMYYFCYDILLMCCENNMILTTIEMIKCIKTNNKYQQILNQKDDNGDNLLSYCQKNNRFEIFIELFQFYISNENITSMIIHLIDDEDMLIKFLDYIANNTEYNFDNIINNPPSNLKNGNYNKNSLLMLICLDKKSYITLKLIDIYEKILDKNRLKIDHSNKNDDTILSIACSIPLNDISLRLIKIFCKNGSDTSEYKKLGAVNKEGNTPLSLACQKGLSLVALELLKTGRANQSVYNNLQKTPLIYACEKKLEKVALEILKIGKCSIEIKGKFDKKDALNHALKNKLKSVVDEILNYCSKNRIKLNTIK
jgi:ankyrin repeat protein